MSKITTKQELFAEARDLIVQGVASDLAACCEDGYRITGVDLAECALDQLYGRIEFDLTPQLEKKLAKSLDYYT